MSTTSSPRATNRRGARTTSDRLRLGLWLASIALAAWGCATGGERAASASAPADVSGLWEGGFTAGPRFAGSYEMTLRQEGDKVTGVVRVSGRRDFPIEGSVRGNELFFQPADSGPGLRGQFVVNGASMVGDALAANNYPYRVLLQRRQPN